LKKDIFKYINEIIENSGLKEKINMWEKALKTKNFNKIKITIRFLKNQRRWIFLRNEMNKNVNWIKNNQIDENKYLNELPSSINIYS